MWRAVGARGKLWSGAEDGVSEAPEPMGVTGVGMAIADVVSGEVTDRWASGRWSESGPSSLTMFSTWASVTACASSI